MPGKLFARKTDEDPPEREESTESVKTDSKVDEGWSIKGNEELVRGKKSVKMMKAKLKEINKGKEKKRKKKAGETESPESEKRTGPIVKEQKYHRAIYATLGWWLILLPVLLIPWAGWLFAFSLIPFIAGRRGSRWLERRYAIEMGVLASIIISVFEIMLLYWVLDTFASGTVNEVHTGGFEYLLLTIAVICNICFCLLGTSSGRIKYFPIPGSKR